MNFFNNCMKSKPDSIEYWQDFTIFSIYYTEPEKFSIIDGKWDELLPKLTNFTSFHTTEEQLLNSYRLLPFHKLLLAFLDYKNNLWSEKLRNKFHKLPKSSLLDMEKYELYRIIFECNSDFLDYTSVYKTFDNFTDEEKIKILKCLIHYDLKKFFDFSLILDEKQLNKHEEIESKKEIEAESTLISTPYKKFEIELTMNNVEIYQELLKVIQEFTFLPLIPQIERCILIHEIMSFMKPKPESPRLITRLMINFIANMLKNYKFESMEEFERIFELCVNLQKYEIDVINLFEREIFKLTDNPLEFLQKKDRDWTEYLEYISIDHLSEFAKHSDDYVFKDFIINLMMFYEDNDELEFKIPSIFYSFKFVYRLQFRFYSKYYDLGYCKWIDEITSLYPRFIENLCIYTLPTIKEVSEFKCAINAFPRSAISKAFEKIESFVCKNIYVLVKYCKEYNEQRLISLINNQTYMENLKDVCIKEFQDFLKSFSIKPFLRFISTMPYACRMFSISLFSINDSYLYSFIMKTKSSWTYDYDVYKFLAMFPRLHHLINYSLKRSELKCGFCSEFSIQPLKLECGHIFCECCIMRLLACDEQKCHVCHSIITILLNQDDFMYEFPETI